MFDFNLDKSAQCDRFIKDSGWNGAHCWSMNEVYNYLPRDEVSRVEKIEFLDEHELVKQLFEHYCITFAWINGNNNQKEEKMLESNKIEHRTSNETLNFDDIELW